MAEVEVAKTEMPAGASSDASMVGGGAGAAKPRRRGGKKPFVFVLSGLLVVIVGLIVAILVVNFSGGAEPEEGEAGGDVVIEVDPDQEIVNGIQAELGSMTDAEAEEFLSEKIEEYKENNGIVAKLTITKAITQLEAGETNCALNTMSALKPEDLVGKDLMNYYSAMRQIYEGLGDETKAEEYLILFREAYRAVFNGGEGTE